MAYVVDTSVIAKVFLAEADRDIALRFFESAIKNSAKLHAPSLVLYELNNVFVSKGVKGGAYDQAIQALMDWVRIGVLDIVQADEDLLRRAEAIASIDTQGQGYISSYDATFHALAIRLGATFLTSDQAYVRKTKVLLGSVDLLQDITI
jgi:predicted nucleic acid-binding protein